MHTFAEKAKATQQPMPVRSNADVQTQPGQSHELSSGILHQRMLGNQGMLRAETVIQTKLVVNTPGDAYEQEAERVAEQVMRMPEPGVQRSCAECEEEEMAATGTIRRMSAAPQFADRERKQEQGTSEPTDAPEIVSDVIAETGRPLDPLVRSFMESRFGFDFSQVRIHTDALASQAADAVQAQAFTVGQNVVFGAGRYAPSTTEGQKLLAHELTHVVQQNHTLSQRPAFLMRQEGGGGQRQQQAVPSAFYMQLYVVRDSSIGLGGGHLVTDLAAFKTDVMRLQNTGAWTLVLAIHGSLDRIAAQAPPNWQQNAVFYTATEINALFNADPTWVQWRDTYGPSNLSLASCQVSAAFEGVMINNLTRHVTRAGSSTTAPSQSARGLGTHCKPLSASQSYEYPSGTVIRTRQQYQRLSASAKSDMDTALSDLNNKYGYYGAPPVPNSQIIDYYFDVDPHGAWAIVTVGIDQGENVSDTDIPFWNRTTGARSSEFRQLCDQGVGTLSRPHTPRVPSVP